MIDFLWQKFSQPEYQEFLLSTKNKILMEGNTWNDTYWGVNLETGEGNNFLGRILMEIRDTLKNSKIKT